MDDSMFHAEADAILEQLFEAVEEADEEGLVDADLQGGVLSLEMEDGKEFVINKHEGSQQIWVSSPVSGASYFHYDMRLHRWVDDDEHRLTKFIAGELHDIAHIEVDV